MIYCANPKWTPGGFHYRCAGLSRENSPDRNDWYCSRECEESQEYVYCICYQHTEECSQIIQCATEVQCLKSEWFL